ncbi:MAG: DUF1579 family protein [Acidimicrobiia bacterium]
MSEVVEPCADPGFLEFDFWLGEWELSWPAEQTGGESGDRSGGSNVIDRLFGTCVVRESFATADDSYRGRSLSVYDLESGTWRQTWVDSSGGYLLFAGAWDGQTMELRTDEVIREDVPTISRMVFRDIEADSLAWDWQSSIDGGQSWSDVWTISYRRA